MNPANFYWYLQYVISLLNFFRTDKFGTFILIQGMSVPIETVDMLSDENG